MTTIYDLDPNPAVALYRHWHMLLSTALGPLHPESYSVYPKSDHRPSSFSNIYETVGVGHEGLIWVCGYMADDESDGLAPKWQPIIALSSSHDYRGLMVLMSDGRFDLAKVNARGRDVLAHSTFLDWGYLARRIRWFVSPTHQRPTVYLDSWRRPTHSIGQHLLDNWGYWAVSRTWCELQPWRTSQWRIALAKDQSDPWGHASYAGQYDPDAAFATKAQYWDWDDAYLNRKWDRREVNWRRGEGLSLTPASRAKVYLGNQTLTGSDAALAIAAVLSTESPAVTTGRHTRLIEAQKEDR